MKLGIVGTGLIVNELLPQLPLCGWEPAAICSTPRSAAAAEALCRQFGMQAAYTDLAEMLAKTELDAVYLGVPNALHFALAKQALEAGKNVILEKPFTSTAWEARELAALAEEKGCFLFEAISTLYSPNYHKIREFLPEIGELRIVSCNFSQYSRRYDEFKKGNILPVFDPKQAGGALMDLNLYNVHYLVGLFGVPRAAAYHANLERGIDTSGVLTLDYDGFQAVSIAAKDCAAPAHYLLQGTHGYILQTTTANYCGAVTLHRGDGTEEHFFEEPVHRLIPEFRTFAAAISSNDRALCKRMLAHSVQVSELLTDARLGAGIRFPAD